MNAIIFFNNFMGKGINYAKIIQKYLAFGIFPISAFPSTIFY